MLLSASLMPVHLPMCRGGCNPGQAQWSTGGKVNMLCVQKQAGRQGVQLITYRGSHTVQCTTDT